MNIKTGNNVHQVQLFRRCLKRSFLNDIFSVCIICTVDFVFCLLLKCLARFFRTSNNKLIKYLLSSISKSQYLIFYLDTYNTIYSSFTVHSCLLHRYWKFIQRYYYLHVWVLSIKSLKFYYFLIPSLNIVL